MSRSFTVEAIYRLGRKLRLAGGRYISSTPAGAAHKAFSQAYRSMNPGRGRITLEIHIRETTRESNHKTFAYKVSKINQSTEFVINGETVVRHYITKVKAL
jgi:hypothetical protein